MASSLLFNIRKALNRDRKKWPVDIYKFERRGNQWTLTRDRGRRVKNPETGDYEYEFLKEEATTASISYEHIQTDKNGVDYIFIAKPEKNAYFPLKPDFEIKEDENLIGDKKDVDMNWVMDQSNFIEAGKRDLERSYKIVQTEDKNWYEDPMVQAVAAFVGFGIFMVLSGIGYSKMIVEGATTAVDQLAKQIDQAENLKNLLPVLAWNVKTRFKNQKVF